MVLASIAYWKKTTKQWTPLLQVLQPKTQLFTKMVHYKGNQTGTIWLLVHQKKTQTRNNFKKAQTKNKKLRQRQKVLEMRTDTKEMVKCFKMASNES